MAPPVFVPGRLPTSALHRYLPIVLLYSLIIPAGISFSIGTVVLFPFRLLLLLSMPFVIMELVRGRVKWVWADTCVLLAALWIFASLLLNRGTGEGLESGAREAIDFAVGYFVARAYIRSGNDVARLLKAFLPGFLFIAAILAFESITHKLVLYPLFQYNVKYAEVLNQQRLGLLRAWGPFPHPIHGGLFMAMFLPLYYVTEARSGRRWTGVLASCAGFFSLSSAAILALLLAAGLTFYIWISARVFRRVNWLYLLVPFAAILSVLEFVTQSGVVKLIIRYFSISPGTGYYRLLIWEYGTASVWSHPWIGIGYAGYERVVWMRSGSVDNHWLALAMRFGLPVSVFLVVAMVLALWHLSSARRLAFVTPRDRWFSHGLTISIVATSACLLTVFAWLQVQVWYMMLLGIAVALSQSMTRQSAFAVRSRMQQMAGPATGQTPA